ncbi:hypothetical protein CH289_06445 [Rhodococcus sp. RS1C4]|nr:VanW family protein [Rhodococcus sp. RS1C4]OZC56353.1 hypothetical protein CH289_06445 [Rhodococcus sp. RS1C4]
MSVFVRGFGRVENVSVGGDGKGKHERGSRSDEEARDEALRGDAGDAGAHGDPRDDVETVDTEPEHVLPYEAITEVMRAIDPDEPPPGQSPAQSSESTVPPVPQPPVQERVEQESAEQGPVAEDRSDEISAHEVSADELTADEITAEDEHGADIPAENSSVTDAGAVASHDVASHDVAAENDVAENDVAESDRLEDGPVAGLPGEGSPTPLTSEEPDADEAIAPEPDTQDQPTPPSGPPAAGHVSSVGPGPVESAPTQAYSAVTPPGDRGPMAPEPAGEDSATVAIPVVAASSEHQAAPTAQPAPTAQFVPAEPADGDTEGQPAGKEEEKFSRMKIAVLAGAAVAILGVFYAADMLSTSDSVPRGVTVAGIEVGGLSHEDAEAKLVSELGPRVNEAVVVDAGDQQLQVVPSEAGLGVDWATTLDRAGSQPVSPFTRVMSFFTDREIGVESTVDAALLDASVESIRAQTDRAPSEGDVVFEGTTPVGVTPAPGQTMDVQAARDEIEANWAFGAVEVPVETVDVTVHQDEVDRVLAEVATPAVSAPVVFTGRDGARAVLSPENVAAVLSFEPDGDGVLATRYDTPAATALLAPQLASTETPPKDATFALGGGAPTVVPAVVGELVQWPKTLEQLPALLGSSDSRSSDAIYEQAQPALTTEGAQALGIQEVVAEYTTGGFEYASGVNIRLTADIVNGALVKPGETFSLNEYTGPRGTAQGFVESGIIDNGRPDRAVGGGISQFATTLYNAAYFGGMEDAGHTEHSYYISRYPEAREATVFEGAIDLKFTNTGKTGVVIESFGSSSDVTVRLWGTKTVDVQSVTGPRSNPTSPNTITLPAGNACVPSGGGPGFTASDTRVITDIATGNEISRDTRTVKYDPIPIVRCESPEPEPEPEDEPADRPAGAAPPAAPPAEDGE